MKESAMFMSSSYKALKLPPIPLSLQSWQLNIPLPPLFKVGIDAQFTLIQYSVFENVRSQYGADEGLSGTDARTIETSSESTKPIEFQDLIKNL